MLQCSIEYNLTYWWQRILRHICLPMELTSFSHTHTHTHITQWPIYYIHTLADHEDDIHSQGHKYYTPEFVTRSRFLTWVEHMTQPWDVSAPLNRNARKSAVFIYIPVTSIAYLTFMHSPWLTESPAMFLQHCDVSSHNLNSKWDARCVYCTATLSVVQKTKLPQ